MVADCLGSGVAPAAAGWRHRYQSAGTRSGVVMQQRSIPPLIADQLATIGITIVDNRLKDPAAVMASRHRGDGRSRPAPEKPIHPALVAAG